jgi:hypothetical protein
MHRQTARSIELQVKDAKQLPGFLSKAESVLRRLAKVDGTSGILITRHDYDRYTVSLDVSVPFGETREKCVL